MESDLRQEIGVKNRKQLIRTLKSNKSEKAISRITDAAETIVGIVGNFDHSLEIRTHGTRHAKMSTEEDQKKIARTLRELRPFKYQMGRKCRGMANVPFSPLAKIDCHSFKLAVNTITTRLLDGADVDDDEDSSDEE